MNGIFITLTHEDFSPCILKIKKIKQVKGYTGKSTKIIYGDDNREIIVLGNKVSVVTKIKDEKEMKGDKRNDICTENERDS